MPAVGKSFWGEAIAQAYSLQFVDLDSYIAEQEHASIPALFAMYGEGGFREREQKYLKQIIDTAAGDVIVASGGGTPCFADNIQLMKNAGTVIYLDADISQLLSNLEDSAEVRPLLKGKGDMGTHLEALLLKRKSSYEQAHFILQTKDISIANFDKIITTCIGRH